jgi:hypothetical protein
MEEEEEEEFSDRTIIKISDLHKAWSYTIKDVFNGYEITEILEVIDDYGVLRYELITGNVPLGVIVNTGSIVLEYKLPKEKPAKPFRVPGFDML